MYALRQVITTMLLVLVNGQDVNLVQVERGMAWFYRQYQREAFL